MAIEYISSIMEKYLSSMAEYIASMAEIINATHVEAEEDPQQQREFTNNQPQTEPDDDDDDGDYVDDDVDEEDEDEEDVDEEDEDEEGEDEEDEDEEGEDEEDEDEEEEDETEEEEDSYSQEEENDDEHEHEEEYMDTAVTSPRVSANSVKAVVAGEPNGCGEGGKVAVVEGGEVDGLICPICMGPWTSAGDHQLCCLSCGHLYGLSCISRWLELCKGSAKCPQCNRKCKPKDVRVLYATCVVVADEESKEVIQFREAKFALLEKKMTERSKLVAESYEAANQLQQQKQCEENRRRIAEIEQFMKQYQQQFSQLLKQHAGSYSQTWTPRPLDPAH